MNVSQLLTRYRKLNGFTIRELSKRVGVSHATLSKYENGHVERMSTKIVNNLVEVLGIPHEELETAKRLQYGINERVKNGENTTSNATQYDKALFLSNGYPFEKHDLSIVTDPDMQSFEHEALLVYIEDLTPEQVRKLHQVAHILYGDDFE